MFAFSRRATNATRMRDRLSWYMVFLILPTILLARSLDKGKSILYVSLLCDLCDQRHEGIANHVAL